MLQQIRWHSLFGKVYCYIFQGLYAGLLFAKTPDCHRALFYLAGAHSEDYRTILTKWPAPSAPM